MNKAQKKALKEKKRKEAKRKAQQAAATAAKRQPVDSYLSSSYQALQAGKPAKAEKLSRQGLRDYPDDPRLHGNLVNALENQNRKADALAAARVAARVSPDFADGHNNLGALLKFKGELAEARTCFEAAVKLEPTHGEAWRNLVATKRYVDRDDGDIAVMAHQIEHPPVGGQVSPSIYFAIGKALEDVAAYDEAFEYYAKGNRRVRAVQRYQKQAIENVVDLAIELFDPEFFAADPIPGTSTAAPILVVGMPRSGSTLVEQILASHPEVAGTGETSSLGQTLGQLGGDVLKLMHALVQEQPESFARLGRSYVSKLQEQAPDAPRLVDKMLSNFMHLGFIARALPNARIVHATRDAMDNALACYNVRFTSPLDFAYDFDEIAHYYGQLLRLMRHWQRYMGDRILTVPYERLVEDQEAESRRLLEFCGLDWNAACLDFHKTDRLVHSASSTQVRQPIYSSSVGRWRNYAEHLQPLREALAKYALERWPSQATE